MNEAPLLPPMCDDEEPEGRGRCLLRKGHDGWHENTFYRWPSHKLPDEAALAAAKAVMGT